MFTAVTMACHNAGLIHLYNPPDRHFRSVCGHFEEQAYLRQSLAHPIAAHHGWFDDFGQGFALFGGVGYC